MATENTSDNTQTAQPESDDGSQRVPVRRSSSRIKGSAVITVTDSDEGMVSVSVEFDPPGSDEHPGTPAQIYAMAMLDAVENNREA